MSLSLVLNLLAKGVGSEDLITRSRQELDFINQDVVYSFLHYSGPFSFIWLRPKLALFIMSTYKFNLSSWVLRPATI